MTTKHTPEDEHSEDVSDGYGICERCGAFIPEGGTDCGSCPIDDEVTQ